MAYTQQAGNHLLKLTEPNIPQDRGGRLLPTQDDPVYEPRAVKVATALDRSIWSGDDAEGLQTLAPGCWFVA
jgi:hypothetical protein